MLLFPLFRVEPLFQMLLGPTWPVFEFNTPGREDYLQPDIDPANHNIVFVQVNSNVAFKGARQKRIHAILLS
jgi:hypothetical protein